MIPDHVLEQYAREYAFSQSVPEMRREVTSWIIRSCRDCGVSWRDQGEASDLACWCCGKGSR